MKSKGFFLIYARILNVLLASAFLVYAVAYFKVGSLPAPSQIDERLYQHPQQIDREGEQFSFDYRGETYLVTPLANYDLHGLVVSHNDITAFYDIYHDEDSVDIKDLCVIWGDNLKEDAYRKVHFHSESVSCHFWSKDGDTYEKFNPNLLSNNHLLSDNKFIRDKIKEARIGDQIHLSGKLINYSPASNPDWIRKSSMSRNDAAGGACEVVFVEDFEFIRKFDRSWFNTYDTSKNALYYLVILKTLSFLILPWLEFKFG